MLIITLFIIKELIILKLFFRCELEATSTVDWGLCANTIISELSLPPYTYRYTDANTVNNELNFSMYFQKNIP